MRKPSALSRQRSAFAASAVLWLMTVLPVRAAADIAVAASVDRSQVAVGESVVLSVEVNGAQNVLAPDLGDLGAATAQYLGPSTQISIVNGQMAASVTHRYAVFPQQPGRLTLGPFTVQHGGRAYTTDPVAVEVLAAGQAPRGRSQAVAVGKEELQLVVLPAKDTAYVGERIPLAVKLYVGRARVDDLQFPEIGGDGFTVDQFPQPTQQDEIVRGRRFRVLTFHTTLTPLRPGALVLGPSMMAMKVLISRRRGGLGDPFFDDFFAEPRPHEVRAEPVSVTIQPLPEEGKPADFAGAVGQFDFALEAKPTELNAGDPITVRMRITGHGNLGTIAAPYLPVDDRFRAYDPQPAKEGDGKASRVFEQVVIPKVAEVTELPAVRFSFFDPATAQYHTITRGPIPLAVRAAPVAEAPRVLSVPGVEAPPPEQLGRDIVYIKDRSGRLAARGVPLYGRWWFLALQALPVMAFAAVAAYVRRRDRLAADPRLVRFRQAGREARRVLGQLGRAADGTRFFDELTAAVHAYLGAKLDLPPGAVEPERVLARFGTNGAADDIRRQVTDFFALVERARYAPSANVASEREQALVLARQIVERLERERGLASRFAAGLLVPLVLVLGLAVRAVAEDVPADPHTAFFEGNSAYRAGRFAEAAAAYERVLAAGLESGALYFNLGNAYFKSGQVGRAILNYARAERRVPRDPDVRANLAYAREVARESAGEPALWERLVFPLASRATGAELAVAGSLLWFGLWTCLALRRLVPRLRTGAGRAAWVLGLVAALVVSSLAQRLRATELRPAAVVVAGGKTPVRFEPSPTGTAHFEVGEGAVLDVTGARDEWLQVRRADGRRGWLSRAAAAKL
jgi:tetratricopeptide (TPR) repeat protein